MADKEPEVKSGGKLAGKLPLIIGLANLVGLGGLAAFVVLGGGGGGAAPPPGPPQEAASSSEPAPTGQPGPMMELGTLVVNLAEPTGDRYLKTKLQLELDSEETRAEVEARMSQARYQLTVLLSGQRVADVQGPESIEALRRSMTRRINSVLSKGKVVGVWPEEWIVQ